MNKILTPCLDVDIKSNEYNFFPKNKLKVRLRNTSLRVWSGLAFEFEVPTSNSMSSIVATLLKGLRSHLDFIFL
jgi:hypothetical protein